MGEFMQTLRLANYVSGIRWRNTNVFSVLPVWRCRFALFIVLLDVVVHCILEMTQYDFDYQETTDGRYERRPYGQYLPKRVSSASSSLSLPVLTRHAQCRVLLNSRLTRLTRSQQPISYHGNADNDNDEDVQRCSTSLHYITGFVSMRKQAWLLSTTVATLATIVRTFHVFPRI